MILFGSSKALFEELKKLKWEQSEKTDYRGTCFVSGPWVAGEQPTFFEPVCTLKVNDIDIGHERAAKKLCRLLWDRMREKREFKSKVREVLAEEAKQ